MEWFKKKRGMAVGITLSGIGIGGLILSNIASAAIASVGYQWTLRIFGFIELVLCGIAGISSKQLPPRPKSAPIVDVAVFKNRWFLVLFAVHFIVAFAFFVSHQMIVSIIIIISPCVLDSHQLHPSLCGIHWTRYNYRHQP